MVRRMIGWADRIGVVSGEIRAQFVALDAGAASKITVIHNGIDAQKFRPSSERRTEIRRTLGWDDSLRIIGTVGSAGAGKGCRVFCASSERNCASGRGRAFFDCWGWAQRAALEAMANPEAIRFVGRQEDVTPWLNAMDVFVLSSSNDAFRLPCLKRWRADCPWWRRTLAECPKLWWTMVTGLLVPPCDVGALHAPLRNCWAMKIAAG